MDKLSFSELLKISQVSARLSEFDRVSAIFRCRMLNSLIINVVVPIRFAYARFTGDDQMQEDALGLLERIPYEDNKTTRLFLDSAFPSGSAYDSQAQLELMDRYCSQKRCLKCAIGEKIVRGMGVRPLNTV